MARSRSWTWTVIISLLVGVVGASIFWLYSPYGHDRLAQSVTGDLQTQPLPGEGKGGPVNLKKLASQAMGSRYQMVADGKQVFLVDLTERAGVAVFPPHQRGRLQHGRRGFSAHWPVLRRQEALHRLGDRAAPRRPGEFPPNPAGGEAAAMNRVWRQDLAWAGFILGVGLLLGLMQQWELVHKSWQGELAPLLSQVRDQRRAEQFQGVKTVNLAQAYALFQQGSLFIDARPADEFSELHVPKSLNITPDMVEAGVAEKVAGLARDREIVVYCGQVSCDLALKVAEKLQSLGFTRVTAFMGGFRAWDEAGYPADTGK